MLGNKGDISQGMLKVVYFSSPSLALPKNILEYSFLKLEFYDYFHLLYIGNLHYFQ